MVIYRSKIHVSLKRNFQLMPGAAWLQLLLDHVPDRGEHLVRYYGWYSNRTRGERRKAEATDSDKSEPTAMLHRLKANSYPSS